MRQIVLDTETTGLEAQLGHRVIEIGCVELLDRRLTGRTLHFYVNPERDSDAAALDVHGLTSEFLADKPLFADIAEAFLAFVDGAQLVIHNAPFDIGFLNAELSRLGIARLMAERCSVLDTAAMARQMHPGQRASLDALCKRYGVDNSHRTLHGALLDAEILGDVYLAMTGGQTALQLGSDGSGSAGQEQGECIRRVASGQPRLRVVRASDADAEQHRERLASLQKSSNGHCLWLSLETPLAPA